MACRGEAAWVRISDKVKTALSDDSVAVAAWSEFAAMTTHLQPETAASLRLAMV